jgi:hypothetical protein
MQWASGRDFAVSELQRGWCEREVEEELPGLCAISLAARPRIAGALDGSPPRAVATRLRQLADRWRGARAINVRQEPVPAAYRVFFRHIGLDPDVVRTPVEALVVERMVDGGFLSKGALADVLTVAVMDTGVPVWALDADTLDGPLGVRLSRPGERLGEAPDAVELDRGRLVLASSRSRSRACRSCTSRRRCGWPARCWNEHERCRTSR